MKHLFALSLLLTLVSPFCHSQDKGKKLLPSRPGIGKERSDSLAMHVPQARGYINDFSRLFTAREVKTLDSLVTAFERATSVEIAVVTLDSSMTNDKDFEDYTLVMMRRWGVGKKGKNNGILIVLSPALRRMRIQNGYGIEQVLSDAETKDIVDNAFIAMFKEGNYFEGTRNGITALIHKLKQNGL